MNSENEEYRQEDVPSTLPTPDAPGSIMGLGGYHLGKQTDPKDAWYITRRILDELYFFNSISASFASGSVIFARILASEGTAPAKAAPSGRVPLTQKAGRSGISVIPGGS